jgi:hypothetical protein
MQFAHHLVEREVAVGQVVQDADLVPKVQHARPQLTRADPQQIVAPDRLLVIHASARAGEAYSLEEGSG